MVSLACSLNSPVIPATCETEAVGQEVQGQLEQFYKTLSQIKEKKKKVGGWDVYLW